MAWTKEDIITHIRTNLGWPKVRIELDATQYEAAITEAVSKYGGRMPVIKWHGLQVDSSRQHYDFTALSLPYGKGLVYGWFEPENFINEEFTVFQSYRIRGYGTYQYYSTISDLLMDRMHLNATRNMTGADYDWKWDQDNAMLYIKPVLSTTLTFFYIYNDDPTAVTDIPVGRRDWIKDYALATSKIMLARVRDKYRGVAGNELGVETDASELRQEGIDEQNKLIEDITRGNRGDWVPPIRG